MMLTIHTSIFLIVYMAELVYFASHETLTVARIISLGLGLICGQAIYEAIEYFKERRR